MALDFPNAPLNGQNYNGYVWDGQKWGSGLENVEIDCAGVAFGALFSASITYEVA